METLKTSAVGGFGRFGRPLALGLTLLVLATAPFFWGIVVGIVNGDPRVWWGVDLQIVLELGRRWLETGTMYLPYQLAGPYSIDATPVLSTTPALYPPAAGPVFGLLNFIPGPVLTVAWWLVPLGLIGYAFAQWRPAAWTWPILSACLVYPQSLMTLAVGGTSLWMAAFVAGGLLKGWPAALILLKPTLAPFALVGVRDRRWWAVALAIGVLTLTGPWQDYLRVAANASDSGNGLLYSIKSLPLVALPLVAWLGRDAGLRR